MKTRLDKYFEKASEYNRKRYGHSDDPELSNFNQPYFLWENTVVALMFQLEDLQKSLTRSKSGERKE